jgi:hypothetical protein
MMISDGLRVEAIAHRTHRGNTFSRLNVQTISDHASFVARGGTTPVNGAAAGWSSMVRIRG